MTTTVVQIVRGESNTLRMPFAYSRLACGHDASGERPIGAEVDCERCGWQAASVQKLREAVAAGIVSHSRSKPWAGVDQIHVYRYEPSSPTGVWHLLTVEDTPEVAAILRGGLSPLSPTEAR